MRLLHRAPERADCWEQFAHEVGGRFVSARRLPDTEEVRMVIGHGPAILDTYHVVGGYAVLRHTRMRAFYTSTGHFEFRIHHKRLAERIGGLLGLVGIRVDDPELGRHYTVFANDEELVRALLVSAEVRTQVMKHPEIDLGSRKAVGPTYPADVAVLSAEVHKVITDLDELMALQALLTETLRQLCRIGAATEDGPRIAV